jgi:hypothetical protein
MLDEVVDHFNVSSSCSSANWGLTILRNPGQTCPFQMKGHKASEIALPGSAANVLVKLAEVVHHRPPETLLRVGQLEVTEGRFPDW